MIFFKNNKFYSETKIRVRYADTDKMGYCYYGNYPTYFEVGRTEFLRDLGLSYKKLEDEGYLLPIANMEIKYLKPAIYDDLLTARTIYKKFHSIKVEFDYELYNQDNQLITTAYTKLVFVDYKTRKPTKAPQYYLDAINKYFSKLN